MLPLTQAAVLDLQSLSFDYIIVRSQRKSAAIHVSSKGVQVRIPFGVSDGWVEEFVVAKQNWIEQKILQQQSRESRVPVIEIGQKVLYLGAWHTLDFKHAPRVSMHAGNGSITYLGPKKPTNNELSQCLQKFFKRQAKLLLVPQTTEKARELKVVERLQEVVFRRTKSKWGHCTSAGRIQYNWLIVGAPLAVIDYLICHEVSHIIQANHSQAFWRVVESLCPDYKELQQWLNDHASELSWC